jgi:hypothetical protein
MLRQHGGVKNAKTWHERGTHVERRPSPPVGRREAEKLPCPRCRAQANSPCHDGQGQAIEPHRQRYGAARAQAQRTRSTKAPAKARHSEPVPIERIRPVPAPQPRPEVAVRTVRGIPVLPGQAGGSAGALRPGEVLEVDCPKCGTEAGQWCPGPDGTVGTHKERSAAARQAGRQLAAEQVAAVGCPACEARAGRPCLGPPPGRQVLAEYHPHRALQARQELYGTRPAPPVAPRAKGAKQRGPGTAGGAAGNNPYMVAAQELMGKRPSKAKTRSKVSQGELDAQYRKALAANPAQASAMRSAGSARGGRGASRKGTGLYG